MYKNQFSTFFDGVLVLYLGNTELGLFFTGCCSLIVAIIFTAHGFPIFADVYYDVHESLIGYNIIPTLYHVAPKVLYPLRWSQPLLFLH